MTKDTSVVEVTLESSLKNVEVADELSRRVTTEAGFPEDEREQIEMAVHESLINAIWHGNKNDESKRVWLRYQIHGDRLEVRIRDQGEGFDLEAIPNPLEEENLLRVSGRGIFLIRSFMDEFQVKKLREGGTEVVMIKRFNSNRKPNQGGTEREHEGDNTPS
ncbi:MAG TPA: ATP-binding protein [Terriglobia bacterium]|nr:ATP-binding protein [Terriglobia bacterium]